MKTCPKCGGAKGFSPNKARKDGLSVYCHPCLLEYQRAYFERKLSKHRPPGDRPAYMRRKNAGHKKLINPIKNVPCVDCDVCFPPSCMEFDHVRGEKRGNVGAMNSWSSATVLKEIEKCDVVCANCHRVRTAQRRPTPQLPGADLPAWKYNKALRQQERIAKFRVWTDSLKKAPCMDCLESFHPAAMDFDHISEGKTASISNMWRRSREEVLAELSKTELVCACCHRLRTEARRVQKVA